MTGKGKRSAAAKPPQKPKHQRTSAKRTIEALRARLEEAEQTLNAIQAGSVDALVVFPPEGGERIFTLQGADHSYRRLVETMREGAATLSEDGVILYCNAHLAELLGVPLERAIGAALRDSVRQSSLARFDAIVGEGLRRPSAGEIEIDTSRGVIPAFISATPSSEEGPVASCIVVTDLTEQKRNEEVVAAERLAVSILDQAAEAIVVCDANARVVRASLAAHRLAGRNPLQRGFDEAFPLEAVHSLGEAPSPVTRALRGESSSGVEAELRRKDGSSASVIVAAAPLRNDQNVMLGSVIALTDVTIRKEAEQRYRFLADSMPQIVWAARPDGVIDYFNQRWFDYTGLNGGSALSWQEVIHPDELSACLERWALSVRSGEPYEAHYRLRREDGEFRWHLGRALPQRDDKGKILRWFGTCTDIDVQKRAEALAEEANRLKDEFLMTVSHELRTPLTSILGWARLLRKPSIDEAMREKGLDTLERCARAQAQLIEDLLDVSRVITGKLRIDVQPLALGEVLGAAVDAARPAASAKGVRLEMDVAESPIFVRGDAVRLQQVAWNLLSNAIKFTPRGGRVHATLTRDPATSHAELCVTDDGAGIAPEFLPFVFDRFRQADSSTTRTKSGLGLGLSIVRHLTELHGGTVHVESDGVGKGCVFRLRLPLTLDLSPVETTESERDPDSDRSPGVDVDLDGLDVLVVDDEANARDLIATVLADYGAAVETAESAADAFAAVQRHPPTVIVSDIGMPLEDGYSFIRKVRSLPAHKGGTVPAVALTAYTREGDRHRALDAGFQEHLGKPIEPSDLAVTVARIARRSIG